MDLRDGSGARGIPADAMHQGPGKPRRTRSARNAWAPSPRRQGRSMPPGQVEEDTVSGGVHEATPHKHVYGTGLTRIAVQLPMAALS